MHLGQPQPRFASRLFADIHHRQQTVKDSLTIDEIRSSCCEQHGRHECVR